MKETKSQPAFKTIPPSSKDTIYVPRVLPTVFFALSDKTLCLILSAKSIDCNTNHQPRAVV